VLPIHSILDELVVWVEVVQDGVRIHLITRCKYDYLKVLRGFLKALSPVRSYIDSSANYIFWITLLTEVNLKHNIWGLILNIVYTVDEGLVHVKNCHLPLRQGLPWFR
jgi:hypothetical protein